MQSIEVTIARRTKGKKGVARRLRATGGVPAILYGPKRTTTEISVTAAEFEKKLSHLEGSHLVRLLNGGEADLNDRMVLIREIQRHPVTGAILHADFYEVDLTERLAVSVPLHFVGKAEGVVAGGILQPVLREIEVECLPTEIPEFIDVDVTALGIHDTVHASQLTLPEGVAFKGDPGLTLVTVLPPTVEEKKVEAVPAEGAPVEGAPAEGAAAAPAAEAPVAGKKGGGEG